MNKEIFLGVPNSGWVNICIENFDCMASYITNIPFDILNHSIIALKEEMSFCLYLHLETLGEVNIYSDEKTYIIHENNETDFYCFDIDKVTLISSLVKQIKENITAWAMWENFEDADSDEIEKNKKELLEKINAVEDLLKEENY